jgi:hypothetical protein
MMFFKKANPSSAFALGDGCKGSWNYCYFACGLKTPHPTFSKEKPTFSQLTLYISNVRIFRCPYRIYPI